MIRHRMHAAGRSWRRRAIAMATVLAAAAGLSGASVTPAHASGAAVILYNYFIAKCVDLPGYGTPKMNDPVSQYDCNFDAQADNQAWYRVQVGDSSRGPLYYFETYKGGWCLDPPGYGADAPGTHLDVYPCNYGNPSADNQEWLMQPTYAAGAYEIINYKSGLCLDVSGWYPFSDMANNLPLTLYPCYDPSWDNGGYDDHLWQTYFASNQ
jgi:hypothetical protein